MTIFLAYAIVEGISIGLGLALGLGVLDLISKWEAKRK